MIKYLLILINSISLFIFGLFNGDGAVTVTSNCPTTITAGQDVSFEITVNKGNMNGFAKLQLELPEGVSIKEKEEKGATYSFDANVAEWVWAELPPETEIVVKLTVVASESSVGVRTVSGKYSYIDNNKKQVATLNPVEVTIMAPGSMPASAPPDSLAKKDSLNAIAGGSNTEPPGNIVVTRKIEKGVSSNDFLVNITINKGITRGFARYSDDLPEGAIIEGAKTDGASFSVADGKIKFVWVSVPERESLEISYTMKVKGVQSVQLNGEYSYLEDNQSKKVTLQPETITITEESVPVAKEETPKEEQPVTPVETPVETPKETPVETPVVNQPETPVTEKKEEKTEYLVQIGAFSKKKVTVNKLVKTYKINETVKSEMQGGFTKFMVGSHVEYKSARDHRETVISNYGIKTAFVVAYNHGKRITVQEALMITNQQWFR